MRHRGFTGRIRQARLGPATVEPADGARDKHLACLPYIYLLVPFIKKTQEGNRRIQRPCDIDLVDLGDVLD